MIFYGIMIPKDIQWCSFFSPPSTPLDSLQLPENDPDPEDVAAESTSRIVKSVSDSSGAQEMSLVRGLLECFSSS